MEKSQQKQLKTTEKIKSSEKLSEPERNTEKPSEKGKSPEVELIMKQKLLEMRLKESKRRENEKKQQESEMTQEPKNVPNMSPIRELPTQTAFQQSYFVQFLNKKPSKEEAVKILEIWNRTSPETQRSIIKNPLYEKLLNIASEISCDAEVEEQQPPKEKETPQKRTTEPISEIEDDEEETTTTKKQKKRVIDDDEDENQATKKANKQTKDSLRLSLIHI